MLNWVTADDMAELVEQPVFTDTMHYLCKAGVWTDRAL